MTINPSWSTFDHNIFSANNNISNILTDYARLPTSTDISFSTSFVGSNSASSCAIESSVLKIG